MLPETRKKYDLEGLWTTPKHLRPTIPLKSHKNGVDYEMEFEAYLEREAKEREEKEAKEAKEKGLS